MAHVKHIVWVKVSPKKVEISDHRGTIHTWSLEQFGDKADVAAAIAYCCHLAGLGVDIRKAIDYKQLSLTSKTQDSLAGRPVPKPPPPGK